MMVLNLDNLRLSGEPLSTPTFITNPIDSPYSPTGLRAQGNASGVRYGYNVRNLVSGTSGLPQTTLSGESATQTYNTSRLPNAAIGLDHRQERGAARENETLRRVVNLISYFFERVCRDHVHAAHLLVRQFRN